LCATIDYGYTASADFSADGIRLLRITDIQDGKVNWEEVPGCNIGPEQEQAKKLQHGDIVFARTGGTTGKSFLIQHPPAAVFASYLIRLRPNTLVMPEYLYQFFQSTDYWVQIRAFSRGGAQPNVNAQMLGKIMLPLPPLPEQRRIVSILNEQLAAVGRAKAAAEARLEAAKALPAAYLREAFGSGQAQRWPRKRLSTLSSMITDGTHQPPPFAEEGVPFLFVRNIVSGRIDFEVEKYVSQETYERLVRRCKPERGDVLYTAVGSFGVAVVIETDRPFTFQRHIAHIKPIRELIDPHFLASYINSPEGIRQSDSAAFGGAQRTVSLGYLSKFDIPTPELV